MKNGKYVLDTPMTIEGSYLEPMPPDTYHVRCMGIIEHPVRGCVPLYMTIAEGGGAVYRLYPDEVEKLRALD